MLWSEYLTSNKKTSTDRNVNEDSSHQLGNVDIKPVKKELDEQLVTKRPNRKTLVTYSRATNSLTAISDIAVKNEPEACPDADTSQSVVVKCEFVYACDFGGCSKRYRTSERLEKHRNKHLNLIEKHSTRRRWSDSVLKKIEDLKRRQEYTKSSKPVEDKIVTLENGLKYLATSKCGLKWFVCQEANCSKSEESVNRMLRHLTVHSSERKFKCPTCLKMFKSKQAVTFHERSVHLNGSFKCDFDGCEQECKTRQILRVHQRRHTGETFNCVYIGCDCTYVTIAGLRGHQTRCPFGPKTSSNWGVNL